MLLSRRRPSTGHLVGLVLAVALALTSCSNPASEPAAGASSDPASGPSTPESSPTPTDAPTADRPTSGAPAAPAEPAPHAISIAALAAADLTGGGLRLGAVRARTDRYTSYDVTYRSTTAGRGTRPLTISGVLNVPTGKGPFPAVVLAHGYIEPAFYRRGQGMTRERGFLADRGYVALHVDYRNHAESTVDPRVETAVRLGYTTDVIAGVRALRAATDVPVDPARIALFGRSMGSGVVLKALEVEPQIAAAGVAWASVSSLEAENFRRFIVPDGPRSELRAATRQRHGLPDDDPEFWRGISSRPGFGEITAPVLMAHGRFDETCPPSWAGATHRALRRADVDATLAWYDDGHAFGPEFLAAMDRTVRFLDRRMPVD